MGAVTCERPQMHVSCDVLVKNMSHNYHHRDCVHHVQRMHFAQGGKHRLPDKPSAECSPECKPRWAALVLWQALSPLATIKLLSLSPNIKKVILD